MVKVATRIKRQLVTVTSQKPTVSKGPCKPLSKGRPDDETAFIHWSYKCHFCARASPDRLHEL